MIKFPRTKMMTINSCIKNFVIDENIQDSFLKDANRNVNDPD